MQSMGLKPWDDDDAVEAKQIAATFAAADEQDEKTSGSKSSAK